MTRAEKKAEERARRARVAVRVLAQMTAKDMVKQLIRAKGERVHEYTARDLTIHAEELLKEKPELFVEASKKAVALGYC